MTDWRYELAPTPAPQPRRTALVLALVVVLCGLVGFGIAAAGGGADRPGTPLPGPAVAVAPAGGPAAPGAPAAGASPTAPAASAQVPTAPRPGAATLDERRFARNDRSHVRADWVAGYYPLYEEAQRAFGVNWLLLASVHRQESAFSTSRGIYHGLNFANCCAGPMQFNVTNGPVSTWARFRDAHRYARRPATYNRATAAHPSVYDDFDAMMAGAWLLRTAGAASRLDGTAWQAAYDYYGHDATGVDYADEVLARALGWGRDGFCVNCAVDPGLVARVDGAYGAPARAALAPAPAPKAAKAKVKQTSR